MFIEKYSDLSLETPGCHPGVPVYIAKFKVDTDISGLFPYINAVGENSVYYEKAQTVQFTLDGIRCAVYPRQIQAAQFEDHKHALAFVNRLIEFLNDLDQKKDAIQPDFTPFKQIPVLNIFKLLPKTNCKKCGFLTCMAFASALSKGETDTMNCPELSNPENENAEKLKALFYK